MKELQTRVAQSDEALTVQANRGGEEKEEYMYEQAFSEVAQSVVEALAGVGVDVPADCRTFAPEMPALDRSEKLVKLLYAFCEEFMGAVNECSDQAEGLAAAPDGLGGQEGTIARVRDCCAKLAVLAGAKDERIVELKSRLEDLPLEHAACPPRPGSNGFVDPAVEENTTTSSMETDGNTMELKRELTRVASELITAKSELATAKAAHAQADDLLGSLTTDVATAQRRAVEAVVVGSS
jgi:hypothetical protein